MLASHLMSKVKCLVGHDSKRKRAKFDNLVWPCWLISRFASLLVLPYLAWVCLAFALTWAVWQGNPKVL